MLFSIHFLWCWQGEFVHQELFQLMIISYTLMTLMFDSGVILLGEIRCLSFLGVKELTFTTTKKQILFVLTKTALTQLQKNHLKVKKKGTKTFANICT